MRSAVYIGGVLLLAAAFLWLLWEAPSRTERRQTSAMPTEAPLAAEDEARAWPSSATLPPGALWHAVVPDSVDAADLPSYKEIVPGRALVRVVDPGRSLAVGERLVVTIPQLGQTYRPVLERVDHGPGSTRSAAGTTTGPDGEEHLFVYTVGPRSSFAFIDTPQGSYELVANARLGWLMATRDIEQHIIDYSLPDTFPVGTDGADLVGPVALVRRSNASL